MNAFAILVVNEHIQSLRLDAARHRTAIDENRPSLRNRMASKVADIRRGLTLPTPDYSFLPKIQD
jgi:hypothetical protein